MDSQQKGLTFWWFYACKNCSLVLLLFHLWKITILSQKILRKRKYLTLEQSSTTFTFCWELGIIVPYDSMTNAILTINEIIF